MAEKKPAPIEPLDYIKLAQVLNKIAGEAIPPDARDIEPEVLQVSIGLSLQAAELAGKAILVALGETPKRVRKKHGGHNVVALFKDAQGRLDKAHCPSLKPYKGFLLQYVEVDGTRYAQTIGKYLKQHFAKKKYSLPRNYLYPDCGGFTYAGPWRTMFAVSDRLIEVARAVAGVFACGP